MWVKTAIILVFTSAILVDQTLKLRLFWLVKVRSPVVRLPKINLSIKLENQLAENEYPLLMPPLFYTLPLQ